MKVKTDSFRSWNKGGIIDITNGKVWEIIYDFDHIDKKSIFKHILKIHGIDESVIRLF